MKSDIEMLIDHLQAEVDYLTKEMNACIEERDFIGADSFSKPLALKSHKLKIAKCLKNPHYKRISQLEMGIKGLNMSLSSLKFRYKHFNENTRERIKSQFRKSAEERIRNSESELSRLNNIAPGFVEDDDRLLILFEKMGRKEIKRIQFECESRDLILEMTLKAEDVIASLHHKEGREIKRSLHNSALQILLKIGFDLKFEKRFPDFKNYNKVKVLEFTSRIVYEVFDMFGDEHIQVQVE